MKHHGYDWDEMIEYIEKELEDAKRIKSLFAEVEQVHDWQIIVGRPSRLVIHDISELHEARTFLRDIFGGWEDSFEHVFCSQGRGIATWVSEKYSFAIWLEAPVNIFPDLSNITGKNCGFIESGITKEWNYVCKVEN